MNNNEGRWLAEYPSAFQRLVMIADLRKVIETLERPGGFEADAGLRSFGIPSLDATLGGGLVRGALHEIAAASEAHIAAVTSFALALSIGNGSVIWVTEDMTLVENGALCGLGLNEFGLAPERLITVAASRTRDLLWAMEEALHCRAVGAVIGEFRREAIDTVALRRLSLAASGHGALALLLRTSPSGDASTAATRWIVSAARSRSNHSPPRINAQLMRNRRGSLGSWMLEWSDTDECFVLASTHSQPVAAKIVNRSARAVA
jgi:protein ImuA